MPFSSKVLGCHLENCLGINQTKSVIKTEKNKYADFQSSKILKKHHL